MGKRGTKPQFIDVVCPNKDCELYCLADQGNVVGNGTSISRREKSRKYICRHCGKVFNDHTGSVYYEAYPKSFVTCTIYIRHYT
jgi:transposase-like protein